MDISLGDEINAATRPYHTSLNKLLLRFLPLAIPPHTPTPALYYYGLSSFFPIYSTFESSFRTLLSQNPHPLRIYIPALERSTRLQHDLENLAIMLRFHSLIPANLNTSEDSGASKDSPQLKTFMSHIRNSLSEKPHLIVAYTWIFYMALFSGGRYIRAKLRDAGNEFWACSLNLEIEKQANGTKDPDMQDPLSFWSFDGESDGEDLKVEYKARILELGTSLTEAERREIVDEAVEIMCSLLKIVRGIEASVAEGKSLTTPSKNMVATDEPKFSGWPALLVKHILPMGLAELLAATRDYIKLSRENYTTPAAVTVAVKAK